jgi:8-oxo-dGTP pyrophosphatase MutT (NUDIX family)
MIINLEVSGPSPGTASSLPFHRGQDVHFLISSAMEKILPIATNKRIDYKKLFILIKQRESMSKIILSGNLIIDKDRIFLLYRKDHRFYETPGGKVKPEECSNPKHPTVQELKTAAQRELIEEVGGIEEVISMEYFDKVEFKTPDGRDAVAHKFITRVKGNLFAQEEVFDKEKSTYLELAEIDQHPLSPDLSYFIPALKQL